MTKKEQVLLKKSDPKKAENVEKIAETVEVYIMGKSGTGKSWLLANMIIDDLKKGKGLAVVDPHGDLCEILLDYIPSHRINDVCYFDPSDRANPLSLNILEVIEPIDAELVTSGIVSIFHKLYGHSWGQDWSIS